MVGRTQSAGYLWGDFWIIYYSENKCSIKRRPWGGACEYYIKVERVTTKYIFFVVSHLRISLKIANC